MNVELEKSMESARESIERRTGTYFTSHKAFNSAMDFAYRFLYDTFGDIDFTPIFSSQEKVIVFHKNGKTVFQFIFKHLLTLLGIGKKTSDSKADQTGRIGHSSNPPV